MLIYRMIPIVLALWIGQAHAYTIVVVTDQQDLSKAKKDIEKIKSTYPFTKFDIDFKIARVKKEQLICGASNGIDRLVTCDAIAAKLQAATKLLGGDHTMVIKDSNDLDEKSNHGGSAAVGGNLIVTTSHSHDGSALHEFMHSLGLSDEYTYSEKDAPIYCKENRLPTLSLTFIVPKDPYRGDSAARSAHSARIPWYDKISSTTLITNSGETKLGTEIKNKKNQMSYPVNNSIYPSPFDEATGLYPVGVCDNSTNKVQGWKPNASLGIMGSLTAGLGRNLEDIAEEALYRKGARYKVGLSANNQKEASVGALKSVDNSSRTVKHVESFYNNVQSVPAGTSRSK